MGSIDKPRTVVPVVYDTDFYAKMVANALETGGFATLVATSSASAITMLIESKTAAVILEVLTPEMDGYEFCARIRDISDVPITMLPALRNVVEIVQALDAGANGYVTKPFIISELIARVSAQLRRVHRHDVNRQRVHIATDDQSIDRDACTVTRGRTEIRLRPGEFRLLSYLATNRGRVVSHNELITHLWANDGARLGPYLKIYGRRLRQKVESDPAAPTLVVSRHGRG